MRYFNSEDRRMIVQYRNKEIRLPDFLVVGAARSGTTTLYSYLAGHPQVFMPAEKEPMFFLAWDDDPYYYLLPGGKKEEASFIVRKLDHYSSHFRKARRGKILGESSTWYLYGFKKVISNIKRLYGKQAERLKIIILLRNPVERAWSQYWKKRVEGREPLSFDEAIKEETIRKRKKERAVPSYDYLGFSRYREQVEAYLKTFPLIKVFFFEEFIRQPEKILNVISDFLEIENQWPQIGNKHLNPAGKTKNSAAARMIDNLLFKPNPIRSKVKYFFPFSFRRRVRPAVAGKIFQKVKLPEEKRAVLEELFSDDIKALELVLERDLNVWKRDAPQRNPLP